MNRFEEIYKNNEWLQGSGLGSLEKVTKGYRKFIEKFVRKKNIKSVVDFGCGDWQFSKFINWNGVNYIGFDIVKFLIKDNNDKFSNKNIHFRLTPKNWHDLPEADLLIVKDVLQHLNNDEVSNFLKIAVQKYNYLLITNGTNPKSRINEAIDTGGYRPLDIRLKPFGYKAKKVYKFSGPRNNLKKLNLKESWHKDVLLINGKG